MVMAETAGAAPLDAASQRQGTSQEGKQTEIGLLPDDWSVVAAGSIGKFRGGNGFPVAFQGITDGEYPFFKVSDMNNVGNDIFMETANNYISESTRKRVGANAFPKGTIVFAKVGAAIFLERKRILARASCIDNNMAGYALTDAGASLRYVYYFLLSQRLGNLVSTTALPALTRSALDDIKIPLPPTLHEQDAIAEALSNADALIDSLESLVNKKRAIKQGAMQELLTGHRRFPGFKDEWSEKEIWEVADVDSDSLGAGTDQSYVFRYISLEDVERGVLKNTTEIAFGSAPSRARRRVRKDDVLFGTVRPNLQSHCIIAREVKDYVCSTGFAVIRCRPRQAVPRFIFATLFGVEVQAQIERLIAGSNYPAVNGGDVRKLRISMPGAEEQDAIASALTEMDSEIAALEQKVAKAHQIKQGLMQKLLTGKVRLV